MPIRPELRHLYRGPGWQAVRARILARAGNQCERCGKPNGTFVDQLTRWGKASPAMWWRLVQDLRWRNDQGACVGQPKPGTYSRRRVVRVVLTIAHLNHDPSDNRDENLRALCQWCHLRHDRPFHYANARRTRAARVGQAWLTTEMEVTQ